MIILLLMLIVLPGCLTTQPDGIGGVQPAPTPTHPPSAEELPSEQQPDESGPNTPPAPEPAPKEPIMTLAVVGDIMLARGLASSIDEHGVDYPFAAVAERLRAADYAFANLESPFGVKGKPIPGKQIWFRAHPDAIEGMVGAGIDGVTLANNHILDYDTDNFLETLDLLNAHQIDSVGGGIDLEAARAPLVIEVNGVKVAFLAYSQFADIFWDWNYPRAFAAQADLPGVAPIREDTLGEDLAQAREQADIVAVAYHWGDEYVNHPNAEQRRLAHLTIDRGADLVLGFHPHAIQGLEEYNGGLIAYSLGNFVMDQKRPITTESMILELLLTPEGIADYEIIPVEIVDNQPRILHGEAARQLLDKVDSISFPLNSARR